MKIKIVPDKYYPQKKYTYPCDNSTCRQCVYFSKGSICCDYYLMAKKHHTGCGPTCDAFVKGKPGKGLPSMNFKNLEND